MCHSVSPRSYAQNEQIKLFVTKVTSTKTQIPYDYYALPYCRPKKANLQSENLGEVISGDRIENSVYKVETKVAKACEVACVKKLRKHDRDLFINAIKDDYRVHWIVDNLPVGMFSTNEIQETVFQRGFPVGFRLKSDVPKEKGKYKYYLYNHIRIIIQYHDDVGETFIGIPTTNSESYTKIVGFRVEPLSIKHLYEGQTYEKGKTELTTCNSISVPNSDTKNYLGLDKLESVIFTYDVYWEKSDTEWANRWDQYLYTNAPNDKVHWFSITNAIMVILLLTVLIAIILIRTLRKDIAKYNDSTAIEEANEESGWKLVHGDVFRPPTTAPLLFSVFVGTGIQLFLMCLATLSFALVGLLSPANRGSLVTALIFLFVFMGSFAGYYSSLTYKMFRGTDWKQNTLSTAFLYPSIMFSIFFTLNLVLWYEGSSGAIPFSSFFTLLFLWFCVSVPLVFLGSFYGYKREVVTFPVRTNQIPRAIPVQPWYMNPIILNMLGGVLPFGAVSVELYFIMSALCGSCAIYTILYAVWYNLTELELHGLVPLFLYYGYMIAFSITFFLITGTIGYIACFWFNYTIYNSIKVD
eukprot:gene17691-23281_t